MPIHYQYDKTENVVHSYLTGHVGVRDLEKFVREMLNDAAIKKGFIEVAHLENIESYKFAFDEALDLPALFGRLIEERAYAGTIFIAINDYQYGMTRMFFALGENFGLQLAIAQSEEEMLKLLGDMRAGTLPPSQPEVSGWFSSHPPHPPTL